MATARSSAYRRTPVSSRPASSERSDGGSFAAAPRAAATVKPPSAMKDVSDIVVGASMILAVIMALFMLTLYTRDSVALNNALMAQTKERSSLICKDGRIARGDNSIPDRVWEDGVFVCTDWRTLQAIETEEQARGIRR